MNTQKQLQPRIVSTQFIQLILIICLLSGMNLFLVGAARNKDDSATGNSPKTEPEKLKVILVELGSTRCIPCKKMKPILDEIEKEYPNQVRVVFHDVWTDAGRPYAKTFKIRIIPTQVFLDKNGKEYFRHEGFFPKKELVKILKKKGVK